MSKKNQKNNQQQKSNKKAKNILPWIIGGVVAVILAVVLVVIGINMSKSDEDKADSDVAATYTNKTKDSDDKTTSADKEQNTTGENKQPEKTEEEKVMITEPVKVKVEMENGGSFVMELYPEYAPQTVQNFVDLVEDGFYDGVGFHRVIDGFMAQGGDPEGTGMGGSGVNIPGEFAMNGFMQNTLSHQRGVVSMARSQHPDSASSQFFICYDDASFLDGQYAAFGKVIEGMEVVDAFLEVERVGAEGGTPTEPITMKTVTVID